MNGALNHDALPESHQVLPEESVAAAQVDSGGASEPALKTEGGDQQRLLGPEALGVSVKDLNDKLHEDVLAQVRREPSSATGSRSGLPVALIRHGKILHWCGYVGVPRGHPLYGIDYNALTRAPARLLNRNVDIDKVGVINLFCAAASDGNSMKLGVCEVVLLFDVHGGLTYSSGCLYGKPGEKFAPGDYWWFGFDCGHAGDYSPGIQSTLREIGHSATYRNDDVYRTFGYVVGEVESLARQLAEYPDLLRWDWFWRRWYKLVALWNRSNESMARINKRLQAYLSTYFKGETK